MAGFDPKEYRRQQAQQFSGTPAVAAPAPAEPATSVTSKIFKPFQESGAFTTEHKEMKDQSFARRVGEDALLLGLAPSAIAGTAVDAVLSPIETSKSLLKGTLEGYVAMFDGREWKEHPLLNTINTIANISVVGSVLKTAALRGVSGSVIRAGERAALDAGMDTVLTRSAFAGKQTEKTFKASVTEAAKTGSIEPVVSGLRNQMVRSGMTTEAAEIAARSVAESTFGKWMTENKSYYNTIDTIARPVAAFGRSAGKLSTPVRNAVFGSSEVSAVGKLYGSEVVKQDLPGFGMVEEWAGMQVVERGLENNVSNRVRMIQEWTELNPEYAALSPLERVKHFQQYAEADLARQRFAETRGRDYVLTKALPQNYVDAMVEFVTTKIKETADDGTPMTNAKILDVLERQFGRDFGLHKIEVGRRLAGKLESLDKGAVAKAIGVLSDTRTPVTMAKLTKAEAKFLSQLEGTGYRIGKAPTGKPISQAAEMTGQAAKEGLVAQRTALGRLIDKLGLSPEGVVEGTQLFAFREAFTQAVLAKFGAGGSIIINGAKYPIESLASILERFRSVKQQNTSGILPGLHTVADIRYKDLIKMGFSEVDAKALDKIIRESNVASPSITGIGEALSNYVRTRNNPLSRAYNGFLKWQSDMRFKKNPMFGIQAAVESVVWGNLWTKTVPGSRTLTRALNRVRGQKTPIANAIGETTIQQEAIVLSEVMGNYNRQLRDAGMSPEIYRGISDIPQFKNVGLEGFAERARFTAQGADSNVWLGAAGFSNVRLTTNLMKSYAGRFGMTLEEALSFKMVSGKKVYDHPWMVNNMQTAAQAIFGYKTGVLTSPLIRTLNTVFFPIRFQTKTMIQTASWLGSLSPMSRLAVINGWTGMAAWLATPEGQKWKDTNRPLFTSLFNYAFAFEGIGKSVDAVTRGRLFNGNTGLIGGLPFGFIATIARDLGYTKQDKQINTTTGMPFQREVVKDTASFGAFVTVVEDIILSMSPSMPFYTATGGAVTVSLNRGLKTFIEQTLSAVAGAFPGDKDFKDYQAEIRKSKKKVPANYSKTPLLF